MPKLHGMDQNEDFLTNPFSLKIEQISSDGGYGMKSLEMQSIDYSKINHTNDVRAHEISQKILPETEVLSLS